MKENGEWNPYYMCSPYGFCHEQRTFPWLYPYGNQMNYWKLWNFPEKMEEEEDARRLSEMYPIMAKRLQPYVEEICIQLEYPGSMMYDEYPDRLSLYRIADTIGKILERESGKVSGDLIQVLVCDEIYKRRHGGKRGMIAFL